MTVFTILLRDLPQTGPPLSAKGARTIEQHKLLHIIAVKNATITFMACCSGSLITSPVATYLSVVLR